MLLPRLVNGRDQGPGSLDEIMTRKERRVTEHRIQQQRFVGFRHLSGEGRAVPEVHHHRRHLHARAGNLRVEAHGDPLVRLHVDDQQVRHQRRRAHPAEDLERRTMELDGDLGGALRQSLPRPEVEGHAGPAPVVEAQPEGHVSLRCGLCPDAGFAPVPRHLTTLHPSGPVLRPHRVGVLPLERHRLHGLQRIHFSIAYRSCTELHGRLHGHQREQLHQVILNHVAQRAGPLVIGCAPLDAHRFGSRDLHVVDVPAVPDRLEHPVCEPEHQQVLHGLLPEIVVDPEYLVLLEMAVQQLVEGPGTREIRPEGLLHDHPAPPAPGRTRKPGGAKPFDNGAVDARRDGQVIQHAIRAADFLQPFGKLFVQRGITGVAADVRQSPLERSHHVVIAGDLCVFTEALTELLPEIIVRQLGPADTDHRKSCGEALAT